MPTLYSGMALPPGIGLWRCHEADATAACGMPERDDRCGRAVHAFDVTAA